MFRGSIFVLATVWCLHAAAPPALARVGPARKASKKNPSGKAKARKFFRKGRRLFYQRRYEQAVWEFERAYQHWKHHSILFNLALAHALQGQKVQAGVYLRLYHKAPGKKRRRLPRILRALKQYVATLIIKVADDRAAIFVDGRRVGYGRVEVVVLAGKRVVEVRIGDWVAKRLVIILEAGTEKTWELANILRPRPRRAVPAATQPRSKSNKRPLGRLHWAYFTAAASVTVAMLSAAIATSIQNRNTHQEFLDRPWDSGLAKTGRSQQLVANVMWGLTGVAAAASIALGVFTRWKVSAEKPTSVTVQAGLWPGGASVLVQW